MILEYHYVKLEEAYKYQGGNILWHYIKFGCGILSACLTCAWVLHIILYTVEVMTPPLNPIDYFLNTMLINAAAVAPFFGTFLYIIFAFYLLFCVIKGNQKLGMRVFFITIHPLKYFF